MSPQQALIESIEIHHAGEIQESVDILLTHVPPEGGHAPRALLEEIIRQAWVAGCVCERHRPFASQN